jgi:thioredoxin
VNELVDRQRAPQRWRLLMARLSFVLSVFLLFAVAAPAGAASYGDFTQRAFDEAQQAGKLILLDVWASWCPTCVQQERIIRPIVADPKFSDLVILRIDFDKERARLFDKLPQIDEKALLRRLNVQQQSTLIIYRGNKEVARSTGETDSGALREFLARAVDAPPS